MELVSKILVCGGSRMPKDPKVLVRVNQEEYKNLKVAAAQLGYRGVTGLGHDILLAWLNGQLGSLPVPPPEPKNGPGSMPQTE